LIGAVGVTFTRKTKGVKKFFSDAAFCLHWEEFVFIGRKMYGDPPGQLRFWAESVDLPRSGGGTAFAAYSDKPLERRPVPRQMFASAGGAAPDPPEGGDSTKFNSSFQV
jgi:hypothetical protein